MRRSVLSRVEKIEQSPKTQEARRQHFKRQGWGKFISSVDRQIRRHITVLRYVGIDEPTSRLVDDWLEQTFAVSCNLQAKHPIKPGGRWPDELVNLAEQQVSIELVRRWHGRIITVEELEYDIAQWKRIYSDIDNGVLSEQSEAAGYVRRLCEQYPRLNYTYYFLPKFKPEGWTWQE